MTLIATIDDGRDSFLAVSDILISDDSEAIGDRDILPLQFAIAPQLSGTIGRAIRSKSLVFGNHLLMWTGNVFGADLLIKEVVAKPPPTTEEFFELATEVQDRTIEELKDKIKRPSDAYFSAILCWHDGREYWVAQFNAPAQPMRHANACVGGTGTEDFVGHLKKKLASGQNQIEAAVISSAGELMYSELTQKSHKYDAYGGGYEFIRLRDGGGFYKMSYSIGELSFLDHISSRRVRYPHLSRVIQCEPHPDGCHFITLSIPRPGSRAPERCKIFWADCNHTRPEACPELSSFSEPEFGLAFMIDTNVSMSLSSKPFVSFFAENERVGFNYDLDALQDCASFYCESMRSTEYAGDMPARAFACDDCEMEPEELNYIPIFDEYQTQVAERHLCDDCFAKYKQGLPS